MRVVTQFRPECLEAIPVVTVLEQDGIYEVVVNGTSLPFLALTHPEAEQLLWMFMERGA